MRGTPLPVALSVALLALALVAWLPAAQASDRLPTGTGLDGECVVLYEFPDAGLAYCIDRDDSDDCLVYRWTQTIAGPETTCVVVDP